MDSHGITPAQWVRGADGTPCSLTFDDIYHAADGGPGQARHVFLHGNGLPQRWQERERFVILENGFGSGLNFLATWAAWEEDPKRSTRLHYLAVEKHPFAVADLAGLHAAWPEFASQSRALAAAWPLLTPGFHRLEFAGGRVILTLLLGDAHSVLRRLDARVDAFYLDGFDPKKNPDMWAPELFRRLARLAAPGATLATWCVAGHVREALTEAGFVVEKRPGFARKRHMLAGRHQAHPGQTIADRPPLPRRAIVLGAGLAGCAVAERLAARGWQVSVIERHHQPASEASGNLAGIVRPLLSRDDNLASRLNRACFLHARRAWAALPGARFNLAGVIQIARDAAHEAQMREIAAAWPADYVQYLDREAAATHLGQPTAHAAWLFPTGGWANPPSLARAWLQAGGAGVTFLGGIEVARHDHDGQDWRLLDAAGQVIAAAPVLILAAGAAAPTLLPDLPVSPVRGQVSHLPAGSLPDFALPACCEGYLTPAVEGFHCLGASYAYDTGTELRVEEHAGNLKRLARILPGCGHDMNPMVIGGKVGFRAATPDRLPLVGALPDASVPLPRDVRLHDLPRRPGLYGLLGLGSRGLVWAALAAETLASRIEGEPLPVENDLADAIDPARFQLRRHRRSG